MTRLILLTLVLLCGCQSKPTPVYTIGHTLPAGARVQFYAQLPDDRWKATYTLRALPRDMSTKEAEKWAISAARTRHGAHWKDYCFRVTPPSGEPVVVWQRAGRQKINPPF